MTYVGGGVLMKEDFYTLKGYHLKNHRVMSASMEDYLEMIYRECSNGGFIRINLLAEKLHVKPSSASKMAQKLKETGYISFAKYGVIVLTDAGEKYGEYLIYRHNVLNRFFCALNHSTSALEEVEQIEHFISKTSVENLEKLLSKMDSLT